MRIRPSSYFLIFILLLMVVVIVATAPLRYIEAKILPLAIAGFVFVLAAIQLAREMLTKDESQPAPATEQPQQKSEVVSRFGVTMGWVVGFLLGIYFFGFLIAIPVFVLSFLRVRGQGWTTVIIFAAVATAFIYAFEIGLGVDLYRGLILGWLT